MGSFNGCGSGVLSRSISVRPWPAGGARRTGEGRLEAPCRCANYGPRLHGEVLFGSSQLRGWGTRLPVNITPTLVMEDDGGVYDVVPLLRHRCWRSWHPTRDAQGETLDLDLPDRMMMGPLMPLSLLRALFWSKCLFDGTSGREMSHPPQGRRWILMVWCCEGLATGVCG